MKTLSSRNFSFRQTVLTIVACFAVVAIGVGVLAVVSGSYTREGSRQTKTLTTQFLPGLVSLARLQQSALDLKSVTLQFALARDEAGMNVQKSAFTAGSEQVSRSLDELKKIVERRRNKRRARTPDHRSPGLRQCRGEVSNRTA
jgi:hypothetical protein